MKEYIEKKKKYQALMEYFEKSENEYVELSYNEIERIINRKLPYSAYKYKVWWSNGGQYHNYSWIDAGWKVENLKLGEYVLFKKESQIAVENEQLAFIEDFRINKKGKYVPLELYLKKTQESFIMLTYKEIEKIINSQLPGSAYKYQTWWSNGGHEHAYSWMNAGYRVITVEFGEFVHFEKMKKDIGNHKTSIFEKLKEKIGGFFRKKE